MAELDAILGPDDGGMDMGMGGADRGAPRRNPAYEQLLTAWRSEQACPEVLPWRGDLVDALLDAAEQQEAMVKATVEQGGDVSNRAQGAQTRVVSRLLDLRRRLEAIGGGDEEGAAVRVVGERVAPPRLRRPHLIDALPQLCRERV